MFIKSGIRSLFYSQRELFNSMRHVKNKTGKNSFAIMIDELYCLFIYGTIFTEYEALRFYSLKRAERKTFITTLYWLKELKKYNPEEYRDCFHEKKVFNQLFHKYVGRQFLDIDLSQNKEELRLFFLNNKAICLKKSDGAMGYQVGIFRNNEITFDELCSVINEKQYDLAENVIESIPVIADLNPTSLNTMRIVTIHFDGFFRVLVACQRIGALGNNVDNISCGGSAAEIRIDTGELIPPFFANEYRKISTTIEGSGPTNGKTLQIPFWNETIDMLKEACTIIPEIHIVGWDVAITPNGPVLVEGNETFDAPFMQLYYKNRIGIKNRYEQIIKESSEKKRFK